MFNMKNVIAFPENKSKKARRLQRQGAQNAVLSFSIVSLMMGALLLNDSLARSGAPRYIVTDNTSASDIQNLNRAIASAHPMNPFRDLEWEKKLAERLSEDPLAGRTPASFGKAATTLEKMRFGVLAGKYRVVDQASTPNATKVQEISYSDSDDSNDRPVYLNPEEFLRDYGSLLSVDFTGFDRATDSKAPANIAPQIREYRLLGNAKQVVGTASFTMNDEGRFLSLKVRQASGEKSQ
jgi:hypothetical protein